MPKYYEFMIRGYYLYFTSHCIVEAMHVHASDKHLREQGSAKFFVKSNGDTVLQHAGQLSEQDIKAIEDFIKQNYRDMYKKWAAKSDHGFYAV